ncbi:MAG: hypothetical protein ACI4TK_19875 [Agathobacter sp.]
MNMKNQYLVSLSLASLLLCSCQQDEIQTCRVNSIEETAREIGFLNLSKSELTSTRSSDYNETADYDNSVSLIARIARPKTNCKSGFGLCDIRAAETQIPVCFAQTRSNDSTLITSKYECMTVCQIDKDMNGTAIFLLASSPESHGLTQETMPPFYVDEEIEQPLEDHNDCYLIVKPGSYKYNPDLGTYGGYSVQMSFLHE